VLLVGGGGHELQFVLYSDESVKYGQVFGFLVLGVLSLDVSKCGQRLQVIE
jgi:hypothetical protein